MGWLMLRADGDIKMTRQRIPGMKLVEILVSSLVLVNYFRTTG